MKKFSKLYLNSQRFYCQFKSYGVSYGIWPVVDLGFSREGCWFYKKLSSELVEEKKRKKNPKRLQPAFVNISKHSELNFSL